MCADNPVWRRLYTVPKNEIIKSLRLHIGDEVLLQLFQELDADLSTLEQIAKASHRQLIHVAKRADNFTEENALHLHEEFRYRGAKTLYLGCYPFMSIQQLIENIDLEEFGRIVQNTFAELEGNKTARKYDQLLVREQDSFEIDDNRLYELTYSYIAIVRTTDPETEETKFHPDLRYSFVWINCTHPWIAVSAKDEVITTILISSLGKHFGINISRLPIPKDVELAIEHYDRVRRATHIDERGIRTRISHENLYDFPDEVEDLQRRDRQSERMSSGYTVTIEDAEFVFNYSRDKGAISFSKLLSTTTLREFGVGKINQIFAAIKQFKIDSPHVLIPEITHRVLLGSRGNTKELVTKIISALVAARQVNQSEVDIDAMPSDFGSLRKFFSLSVQADCEYCDDLQNIQCVCGNKNFILEDGHTVCTRCKQNVVAGDSRCILNHDIHISHPTDLLTWYPTSSFLEILESVTTQASQAKFNRYEEGFFIRGRTLHLFGVAGEKTIYLSSDIPEFAQLASVNLSEEQAAVIEDTLNKYKEKCRSMSHSSCSACTANRVGPHCLMRLYGLLVPSYTPRPHHNGEFGDVSFNVTLDGWQDQTMVILLKSGSTQGHPITLRQNIGQDIYTQLVEFWTDSRVDIIGISVSQKIDDGFAAQLQKIAKQHRKKLVFLGPSELSYIIQHVSEKHNLQLDEL
jgi:hypothetical protein